MARPADPDAWYRRITERYVDGDRRETGSDPVQQLEIETSDGESMATVFAGP